MKKYIIVSLLAISFIITPVFVSAQTSQQTQIIRLLQSLIQLLTQQLQTLRMQNSAILSPQQRADILRNLSNTNITVLSPNVSGEILVIGSSKLVTWSGNATTLSLLRYPYILDCMRGPDEGGTRGCNSNSNAQYNIIEFPNATAGSYVWRIGQYDVQNSSGVQTVPSGFYAMLVCRGLEYSDTACDISDSYFNIYDPNQSVSSVQVLSPNGGEEWTRGANLPIRWYTASNSWDTTSNSKVDVMLKLQLPCEPTPCSPSQGETIVRNVSGGSYNWIVGNVLPGPSEIEGPNAMIGNYKIKICLAGTQTCDSSDLPFRIVLPAHD